jgi:hypothetical protein
MHQNKAYAIHPRRLDDTGKCPEQKNHKNRVNAAALFWCTPPEMIRTRNIRVPPGVLLLPRCTLRSW